MSDVKLCVDCVHHDTIFFFNHICNRLCGPKLNIVTGKTETPNLSLDCRKERSRSTQSAHCGEEAQYFKPKDG